MQSAVITVTTTATLVVADDDIPRTVYLHNTGGATVYLGSSSVTTSSGFHLPNGDTLTIIVPQRETIYGITSGGSCDIALLRPNAD